VTPRELLCRDLIPTTFGSGALYHQKQDKIGKFLDVYLQQISTG
jgi:hypothetical protein